MANGRNRKSVLIIVENLPVPRDRRVWLEALTLRNAGYEVSVICPRTKAFPLRYEMLDGVHIHRHPLPAEGEGAVGYVVEYSAALFWQFLLAWRVLLARGFDVIHACNPPETIFLVGLFFKLLLGKKFIFDHHDLSPELYLAKFDRKGFLYRMLLLLERWTFRTADISIATNDSFKRIAIERGGMDEGHVYVVRSGPDLKRFRIEAPEPALKKGRRFLVGYLGVMNNQDGVEYMLEAQSHIVHRLGRRDVHLALLGDGPQLKHLRQMAKDLEIDDYVTFTGWADDDVMVPMLNTADVCVAPDPHNAFNDQCTMNKTLEYMALAKPAVQFDLTEGRFSAGEAAVYAARNDAVDLGNKILALLDDEEARRRMGALGRKRIEGEFAWQHQIPVLLAAYEAVFVPVAGRRRLEPGEQG